MAYTKTNWVTGEVALSADNFNHMEQGIYDAHEGLADSLGEALANLDTTSKTLVGAINEVHTDVESSVKILSESTSLTVAANSSALIALVLTPPAGFTPVGIKSVYAYDHSEYNSMVSLQQWRLQGNSLLLVFRNSTSAKATTTAYVEVLCVKTSHISS